MIEKYSEYYPVIYENVFVHKLAYVSGKVILSENCNVWPFASIRGDLEFIRIGSNTNIQDNCILHTSRGKELIIGNNVTVGHGSILHSCNIGDNCLIGMGAIVLDDAVVKENTIVAAGTVIPPGKILEPDSLYMGSPVVKKRGLTSEDIKMIKKNADSYLEIIEDYNKD